MLLYVRIRSGLVRVRQIIANSDTEVAHMAAACNTV